MNIDLGNYERYEKVRKILGESLRMHRETIKESRCDKHDLVFNGDDRFKSADMKIALISYRGYYGDSGCSTSVSVGDRDIFESLFVEYLNTHINGILDAIVSLAEEKANASKASALSALELARQEIEAVGSVGETE